MANAAALMVLAIGLCGASAAQACSAASQGDGFVTGATDARTLRLADGREIRLVGLAPVTQRTLSDRMRDALAARAAGRRVLLEGDSDVPDRYGRQSALVRLDGDGELLQTALLAAGETLRAPGGAPDDCDVAFTAAEQAARAARRELWQSGDGGGSVIKNAERFGDDPAAIGHFAVAVGRVVSVRQSGAWTYVNFGRRWTRDLAVTIPKEALPAFEAAGMAPKTLEGRRLVVRGFAVNRNGPRIEATLPGQIAFADGDAGR